MAQNIITYPPTSEGWNLVCALQKQIHVFPINGDRHDIPQLALATGETYTGFEAIMTYLNQPKAPLELIIIPQQA